MFAKWIAADNRFSFSLTDNGGAEITTEEHRALMIAQADGKCIQPDAQGRPEAGEITLTTEEKLAAIEAKYDATFGRLRSSMSVAMLADGPGMDAKVAALRAEWAAASSAQSAEIAALIGG